MTNNPGYTMDSQRIVLETISEDAPAFVADIFDDFYGFKPIEILDSTSELIVDDPETLEDKTKSQAFIAGSLAVLTALSESDCDGKTIESTRTKFLNLGVSDTPIVSQSKNPKNEIDKLHKLGLLSHGEIVDHLDFIAQYYTEITQDAVYGNYVYIGGGFCAYLLDSCYEDVLDSHVSDWIGQDLKSINWLQLLEPNS